MDKDIVPEESDGLRENRVIVIESGVDDSFIEDRVSENVDEEDLLLSNREAEEVDGNLVGRGVQDRGHDKIEGACLWNILYLLPARVICAGIGLLPHVLPIWGRML